MCTDCNVNTELVLSLHVCVLSRVWLFAIPWTIAHQAPLFMGFSRQEHWRALPFLSVAFLHCRFFAFWITREAYPVIHFPNCTDVWSHLTQGSMGTLCTFSISMNFSLQCEPSSHWALLSTERGSARFGSTYTKIGMVQKRLAWPLCKDDMQIHEVFHIKKRKKENPVENLSAVDAYLLAIYLCKHLFLEQFPFIWLCPLGWPFTSHVTCQLCVDSQIR